MKNPIRLLAILPLLVLPCGVQIGHYLPAAPVSEQDQRTIREVVAVRVHPWIYVKKTNPLYGGGISNSGRLTYVDGVSSVSGAIGYAFSQTGFSDPVPTPRLTVVVDNYSQASDVVLARAEREADRIFRKAGFSAVWSNCSPGQSAIDTQRFCQKAVAATHVILRILPAPVLNKFQDSLFGFAVHPVLASVYYEYVLRLAKTDDAEFELPIILGCAIAHEIGHLLLGPDSHSGTGIMQRKWEREQLRQAMMGTLLFTSEQSKVIRDEVQRRCFLARRSCRSRSRDGVLPAR